VRYRLDFMERHRVVPIEERPDLVTVGVSGNPDAALRRALQACHGRPVRFVRLSDDEITIGIQQAAIAPDPAEAEAVPSTAEAGGSEYRERWSAVPIGHAEAGAPAVNVLNSVLNDAVRRDASDVHLEAHGDSVAVRYRVDGVLRNADEIAASDPHARVRTRMVCGRFAAVSARVKVLAGLNAADQRHPQDGRFTARLGGDTFDVRVSAMPTIGGESLVLRLFPRTRSRRRLDELGMPEAIYDAITDVIEQRSGFVLLSGPTGSGKTTTLHAALTRINRGDRKIITIEDPVEYRLPGVEQVQTNEAAGLTFDVLLRRVLRQDPNVIMVGEIRDRETAALAVRASLTGHLVLATVHARSAREVRNRMIDLGIDASLFDLLDPLLIAQRLVRTRCPSCAASDSSERCAACHGTGLLGRTGIFGTVRGGRQAGTLEEDGERKVRSRITTAKEVVWATRL